MHHIIFFIGKVCEPPILPPLVVGILLSTTAARSAGCLVLLLPLLLTSFGTGY